MFYVINEEGILQWEVNVLEAIPTDCQFTNIPPTVGMIRPQFNGETWEDLGEELYVPTHEDLCFNEKLWRNTELSRADIELNKVQDGVGVGSVAAWRQYRIDLRNWPEDKEFPNPAARPVAPDAQ